ncbi:MAG: sulfonate transport system substrate-binding protein [Gammaproteobacteria bacterium]|nr:sulfonate transport system substrate-binding protein [Gammaproteobacteria bacterium]
MINTARYRLLFQRAVALALILPALPAAADPVKTVTIATTATVLNGQAHYSRGNQRVIDEGWLAEQLRQRGIQLIWVPVQSDVGASINEAFSSHRIEFGAYGDLPSIILNASGTRTQIVVPDGRGLDTLLVVPLNSTATSLKDLKGKRIAVHRGRPWYLTFLRLVEQNGLKPRDFTLVNIDLQPSTAALAGGNIDALFAINAYTLAEKGLGKIIWTSKGQSDKKIRAELWGAKEFIDQHPDLTQLVATAYVRAQYWEAQDRNRAAVIKEGTLSGTPEKAVLQLYDDNSLAWKDFFTPISDQAVIDHYRLAAGFALDNHLIRTPIRAEDLLQPKFVTEALKDLQLEHFWTQVPVAAQAASLASKLN